MDVSKIWRTLFEISSSLIEFTKRPLLNAISTTFSCHVHRDLSLLSRCHVQRDRLDEIKPRGIKAP